jgi:hypothetical protein
MTSNEIREKENAGKPLAGGDDWPDDTKVDPIAP